MLTKKIVILYLLLNCIVAYSQISKIVKLDSCGKFSNEINIEMVYVKGGTFVMGNTKDTVADEVPAHKVRVNSFYIGKYEITQQQWVRVMGKNPSSDPSCLKCPVDNVAWTDIQEFIEKLNICSGRKYRLPTEAEWEFAARGGKKSQGYKYSGSNNIDSVAWYSENCKNVKEVGLKKPNELGVYDMSGNVWECCNDWFGNYAKDPQENPKGPLNGSFRVYRGGAWFYKAEYIRVLNRSRDFPDDWGDYIGFRLAMTKY